MTDLVPRPCPLCGGTRLERGAVSSRPSALDLSFEEMRRSWAGFFHSRVFLPYGRCADCGQLYCPVYFSEEQLAGLYADMDDNTAGVDLGALRRTQARYAAMLLRHAPAGGDYLEVGPDLGLLAAEVAARRDGDLSFFEPNRAVWPALQERFAARGCRLSAAMDDFTTVPHGSIGAAAMVHVLDHLLDPVATVRELAARLAPGGALLVVAHDESSLLARALGPRWLPYCLQHPQLYRAATLARTFERAGLQVVAVDKATNDFPAAYLLKHALAAVGAPHDWVPDWRRPVASLRLGNLVAVARRAGEAAAAPN